MHGSGYERIAGVGCLDDPRNGVPQDVYDAYVRLKSRSIGARYLLQTFSAAQVRNPILDTYLARIAGFLRL